MDGIINIKVGGNHLTKDSKNAGVSGEANVTILRIAFDESWDRYAKTVTFFDARDEKSVKVVLGFDLQDRTDQRIYLVPIPKEPLAIAGDMRFVIDGWIEAEPNKRKRSIECILTVKYAPSTDNAVNATEPTPTVVEQLQGEIEHMQEQYDLVNEYGNQAEYYANKAQEYRNETQDFRNESEMMRDTTEAYKDEAKHYVSESRKASEDASKFAEQAHEALTKNPYIGENGNWHVWDAEGETYVDTGVKAQAPVDLSEVYNKIDTKVDKEGAFGLVAVEPYFDSESDEEDPYTWDKVNLINKVYDDFENQTTERTATVYSAEGADKKFVEKVEGKGLSSNDFTDGFMNQLKNLTLVNLGVFDLNLDDGNASYNEDVYQSYLDTIDNLDSGIYTLKYMESGYDRTEFYFVTKGYSVHGDYSSQIRFKDNSVFDNYSDYMCIERRIYSDNRWTEWIALDDYINELNYCIGDLNILNTDNTENLVAAINEIYDDIHQTPITVIPTTLLANQQYNLGEVESLSLTFPTVANDGDVIYLTFYSGATPTTLTIDTTNTCDIEVIPEANTGYEIFGKYNGSIWIVNYSEYTVSEV